MANSFAPIGVFDSGIGGLSILKALQQAMPSESFVYFADTQYNPYGEKAPEFVVSRSMAITDELISAHRIKALVVACNTATAAAIEPLRLAYPDVPIVGVEPALKPAALATRTGRVLVLATRGTLLSEKFDQLKTRLESGRQARAIGASETVQFICVACDGLAERIEALAGSKVAWQNTPELIANYVDSTSVNCKFSSEKNSETTPIDTLVLGCTHYPLVRDLFQSKLGQHVKIVDNAEPVAQRTLQLLGHDLAPSDHVGSVKWLSSGDVEQLQQSARYWGVSKA
jgi:glutamate racemase